MIKQKIRQSFPTHLDKCHEFDATFYVADYTNDGDGVRGVEASSSKPSGIDSFEVINDINLATSVITFDNSSFTNSRGEALSQCECVVFPQTSTSITWLMFLELKYSVKPRKNNKNLKKAILQLYKTRTYYKMAGIFEKTSTCYLFASLPMQTEPFRHSLLSPSDLQNLKSKHNVVLRFQNSVKINSTESILV